MTQKTTVVKHTPLPFRPPGIRPSGDERKRRFLFMAVEMSGEAGAETRRFGKHLTNGRTGRSWRRMLPKKDAPSVNLNLIQ